MDNRILEFQKKYQKKNIPDVKPGDTLKVHQIIHEKDAKGNDRERVQIFEGICIAVKHGKGLDATFTLRRIAADGIGVEKVLPLHLPTIVKIEKVKSAKVRRAKLYYLRQRTGKAASKLPGEKKDLKMWEEAEAEKELEKIQEEKAEEAAEKEAEKKVEEKELEKKFEQAVATHDEQVADGNEQVSTKTK